MSFYTLREMKRLEVFLQKNGLFILVCLLLFLNGFQSGGNQAFLLEIGSDLTLDTKVLGAIVTAQWSAVIFAPVLAGLFADKKGKKPFILVCCFLFLVSSIALIFAKVLWLFLASVFVIGLSSSVYQSVSMAAVSDAYPKTFAKKMGILTSFFPFGAVVAPLVAKALLSIGQTWHTFYLIVSIVIFLLIIGLFFIKLEPQEEKEAMAVTASKPMEPISKRAIIVAIICLVYITAVFVGVENGIANFLKPLIKEELAGTLGEVAISLYWLGMIPSRLLCAALRKYQKPYLVSSIALTAVFSVGLSFLSSEAWVLVFAFILGFTSGSIYTLTMSLVVEYVPTKSALATGFISSGTGFGAALGPLMGSLISASFGIRRAFIVYGCIMASSLIACLIIYLKPKTKKPETKEIDPQQLGQ